MYGGMWGPSPFDIFYYRPYYSYGDVRRDEMNFLEAVYSYVFGDGDPNADVTSRQVAAAADVIRASGGAVVAEQLAPFLALPPGVDARGDESAVDEAFVLPVVAELDGRATVDAETGHIVYVFDDLVKTASDASSGGDAALEEADVTFSRASDGQLFAAGALGVANLGVAAAAAFYATAGLGARNQTAPSSASCSRTARHNLGDIRGRERAAESRGRGVAATRLRGISTGRPGRFAPRSASRRPSR